MKFLYIPDLFSEEVLQKSFEVTRINVPVPVMENEIVSKTNSLFIDNILEDDLKEIKNYFSKLPGFNDMRTLKNKKDNTYVCFIIFVNDLFSSQAYHEFIRFKNKRDDDNEVHDILKRYHINYTKFSTRKLKSKRTFCNNLDYNA